MGSETIRKFIWWNKNTLWEAKLEQNKMKLNYGEQNRIMGSEKEQNYNMGAKLHYGSEIE